MSPPRELDHGFEGHDPLGNTAAVTLVRVVADAAVEIGGIEFPGKPSAPR